MLESEFAGLKACGWTGLCDYWPGKEIAVKHALLYSHIVDSNSHIITITICFWAMTYTAILKHLLRQFCEYTTLQTVVSLPGQHHGQVARLYLQGRLSARPVCLQHPCMCRAIFARNMHIYLWFLLSCLAHIAKTTLDEWQRHEASGFFFLYTLSEMTFLVAISHVFSI